MSTGFLSDATAFLENAGYSRNDLVPNCPFTVRTDAGKLTATNIGLVAFAQYPHDTRNACIAAIETQEGYHQVLASLRYLTVPLALVGDANKVELWSIRKTVAEQPFDVLDRNDWKSRLHTRLTDFSPQTISAAKADRIQLDFVDAGLEPWTNSITDSSLQSLLEDLIESGLNSLAPSNRKNQAARRAVLSLIFSLFTCRALEDKSVIPQEATPQKALATAHNKFSENINPDILNSPYLSKKLVLSIFTRLRQEFSFATLTTDILAHAYENSLVTKKGRHDLGIYYTPKPVIDYILRRLPIESFPMNERNLWDPCCGCGSFLVAGFHRLAAMLPKDWTPGERHKYLRKHIFGSDIDELARELASLALVITDLHNHNGWDIRELDASSVTHQDLPAVPSIVATNLPFREVKTGIGTRRELSADILRRVLSVVSENALLAIIVPQSFLDTSTARDARKEVLEQCDVLEIALFPAAVFESATESAVLFLRKRPNSKEQFSITTVRELRTPDFQRFTQNGSFTRTYPVDRRDWSADHRQRFIVSPLTDLWRRLEGECKALGTYAEIKNGLQIKKDDRVSESDKKRDARDKRYVSRLESLRPFALLAEHGLTSPKWIRYGPQLHRQRDPEIFKGKKVLINGTRNPGSAWRLIAAMSTSELYFFENFHAVIPKGPAVTVQQLAAVLNSPIANAWFDSHSRKRKVIQGILRELPFPEFDAGVARRVDDLVDRLEQAVIEKWKKNAEGMFYDGMAETSDTASLVAAIDDLVFTAYGLSPHERKQVSSLMSTDKRPG